MFPTQNFSPVSIQDIQETKPLSLYKIVFQVANTGLTPSVMSMSILNGSSRLVLDFFEENNLTRRPVHADLRSRLSPEFSERAPDYVDERVNFSTIVHFVEQASMSIYTDLIEDLGLRDQPTTIILSQGSAVFVTYEQNNDSGFTVTSSDTSCYISDLIRLDSYLGSFGSCPIRRSASEWYSRVVNIKNYGQYFLSVLNTTNISLTSFVIDRGNYIVSHSGDSDEGCSRYMPNRKVEQSPVEQIAESQFGLLDMFKGLGFDISETLLGVSPSEVKNVLENVVKDMNDASDRASSSIFWLGCGYVCFAATKFYLYGETGYIEAMVVVVPLFVAQFGQKFQDFFKPFLDLVEKVAPQSGSEIPWNDACLAILTALSSYFNIKPKFSIRDILSNLAALPKAADGFEKIVNAFFSLFREACSLFMEHVFGKKSLHRYTSPIPEIKSFFDQVSALHAEFVDSKDIYSTANYDLISNLQKDGLKLLQHPYVMKDAPSASHIKYFLGVLGPIRRKFDQSTLRAEFSRMGPMTTLFVGKSGVGKSTVTKPFLEALLATVMPEALKEQMRNTDDLSRFVYNRCFEQEFWDGYRGQFAMVIDDAFQAYDQKGTPANEYFEMIRATNRFPYSLHMAALEEKGSTIFCSNVILCSTNDFNFQTISSVKEPSAFHRRFDIRVQIMVKEEFGIRKVGMDHMCYDPSKHHDSSLEPWIFRVEKVDLSSGHLEISSFEDHDFRSFVDLCCETYWMKEDFHRRINAISKTDRDEYLVNYDLYADLPVNTDTVSITCCRFMNCSRKTHCGQAQCARCFPKTSTDNSRKGTIPSTSVRGACSGRWMCGQSTCHRCAPDPGDEKSDILTDNEECTPEEKCRETWCKKCVATSSHNDEYFDTRSEFSDNASSDTLDFWKMKPSELLLSAVPIYYRPIFINMGFTKVIPDWALKEFSKLKEFFDTIVLPDLRITRPKLWVEFENGFEDYNSVFTRWYKDNRSRFLHLCSKMDEVFRSHYTKVLDKFTQLSNSKFIARITNLVSSIWEKHKVLLSVAAAIPFATLAWKLLSSLISNHSQWGDYMKRRRDKVGQKKKMRENYERVQDYIYGDAPLANAHSGSVIRYPNVQSENTRRILSSIGDLNYVVMMFPNCVPGGKSGILIGLCEDIVLCNSHFFKEAEIYLQKKLIDNFDCIQFYTSKGLLDKEISVQDFVNRPRYDIPGRDLTIFRYFKGVNKFPNILKNFVKSSDLQNYSATRAHVLINHTVDEFDLEVTDDQSVRLIHDGLRYELYDKSVTKIESYVALPMKTSKGDCGSLYFLHEPFEGNRIIFGVHCAGRSLPQTAYATFTYRDELDSAIKVFNGVIPEIPRSLYEKVEPLDIAMGFGDLPIIAKSSYPFSSSSNTQLRKTKFYGVLGPVEELPAKLGPFIGDDGVLVDPLKMAIQKYTKPNLHLSKKILDRVVHVYWAHLCKSPYTEVKDVLSFDDACCGLDGEPFLRAIPRNTSAGFPYNLETNGKQKKGYFGDDMDYRTDSEDCVRLRSDVDEIIANARNGVRLLHIYQDVLKDETRPLDRVAIGKTRLVSCAPLALTVAIRMYTLRFSSWIMKNRIHNCSAVGINPYSKEWNHVAAVFAQTSKSMIAGDHGGFDTRQVAEVMDKVCDIINWWYNDGEENFRIRKTLFKEITSSVHLYKNFVYMWSFGGMPSGNPLTTIINSLSNVIYIMICYSYACDSIGEDLDNFFKYVRVLAYGDDNIIGVSDVKISSGVKLKEIFNQVELTKLMAELGFEYTDENKSTGAEHKFRSLGDVSFLKRSFVFCEHSKRYIAPLSMKTLDNMLNFVKFNVDQDSVVKQAFHSWHREMALHDESEYKRKLALTLPIMKDEYDTEIVCTDFLEMRGRTLAVEDLCW